MALDMMLKTLLVSSEFHQLQDKNWTQISRMIPGTTPRQCQRRYEELLKDYAVHSASGGSTSFERQVIAPKPSKSDADAQDLTGRSSRPSSAKIKGSKLEKDTGLGKNSEARPLSGDQGPVMVIHVCDEAKNLKQDFHCARDLLIREMRYFAEYLSTDAQRWEEVDISVHCDVQIFEWLMKYVKRQTKEVPNTPQLEPTNVISILISSDFLKMDSLVEECIHFCHKNMSAIVATPCNMNCINDKLVTRISDLFTHNEANDVVDRKDKFKSKLFAKKLERLFEPSSSNPCSPENASTLYRCSVCKRLLTKTLETKLKCLQSRLLIDRQGRLCYNHIRDPNWDCNDYLLELKQQLKNWRDVYWRVWGTINWLTCSRCYEVFPCSELGHCQYHPESAVFDNGPRGEYPCCKLKILRFDPAQPNKYWMGCKVRDHIVDVSMEASSDPKSAEKKKVHSDMLAHRDAICVSYNKLQLISDEDMTVDIFSLEEQACGIRESLLLASNSEMAFTDESQLSKPRLQALTIEREMSYDDEFGFGESDDEVGDDEEVKKLRSRKSRVTVDPQAILVDAPDFNTTKTRKWDSGRSLRWNQDAQREEDQRRMYEIITYLTKLRMNPEKVDKFKQKEYLGGLYSKLEAQWKMNSVVQAKAANQFRNKPRLGTIPK